MPQDLSVRESGMCFTAWHYAPEAPWLKGGTPITATFRMAET